MKAQFIDSVSSSLFHFFKHKLLEQEAFITVLKGQTTPQGVDLSKLYPVVDKALIDMEGYVWQSSVHNWNYESGISTSPAPIVASGVYIDGAFKATNNATYAHSIDYNNGRVLFSNPVSTSSVVQADFSYGEFSFVRSEHTAPLWTAGQSTFNSAQYLPDTAADPALIYLPCIFMELDTARDEPFQFGGTNSIHPTYKFTILGTSQPQVDRVADLFLAQRKKAFCIVNADNWPLFNGVAGIISPYSYNETILRKTQVATCESVKYNRFLESRDYQAQPQVYAGSVILEVFAVRN